MPPKSCYGLDFTVEPGGARKDAHYIRGSLDEIKADLAGELRHGVSLYLLCWYGAELTLRVFERGEATHTFDLHPLITIAIEGYPAITFDANNRPIGHEFRSEDADDDDEDSLTARMFDNALGDSAKVTVDWNRLDVPALRGDIARAGDVVDIDGDELPYGFTDREA